jgi:hypothetical protein
MSTALIDADVLTYTVGFAAQKTLWEVRDEGVCIFASEKEDDCLNYIETMSMNLDVVPVIVPDKVENALHTVKQMIKRITAAAGCQTYRPYLTGKHNFRERIATLKKYKGNRVAPKPYHYDNIREYLVSHHRAIVVDGMEADDAIAIIHSRALKEKRRTVICSIDKDFDQIVGPHYYFKKDKEEYYEVTPKEAHYAFWKQLLTGDATDNIQGIKGCGDKTATKILAAAKPKEYEMAVLAAYRAAYGDFYEYHHWSDSDKQIVVKATPEALMIENARLLYLLRDKPGNGIINLWKPSWLELNETIPLKP